MRSNVFKKRIEGLMASIRLVARSFEILLWDLLVNFLVWFVLKHVEMLCFYIVLAHVVGSVLL